MYGHKWTSANGLEDTDHIWARALSGITGAQIANGLEQCLTRRREDGTPDPWPPSAPEFRGMCENIVVPPGMPDFDAAWDEASKRASHAPTTYKFSHDAVRLAGSSVGWHDILHCKPTEANVRRRFAAAYQVLVRKVLRGEPLTKPLTMIENGNRLLTPEEADEKADAVLKARLERQGLTGRSPRDLIDEMKRKLRGGV